MNIAIFHYHLNRGGVTRVITNHLQALNQVADEKLNVSLVYGGRRIGWQEPLAVDFPQLEFSTHVVPELDYDEHRPVGSDLTKRLLKLLENMDWNADDTILHFHNHSLGKNTGLPTAIRQLAEPRLPDVAADP